MPEKIIKPPQIKKVSPDNSGLKGIMNDSKNCVEQIRKILVVVQDQKSP